MKYELHRLDLPNLSEEIKDAWDLGQHRAHERWRDLGITAERGNELMLGANLIIPIGPRRYRPARGNDPAVQAFMASIMPTRFINGVPFDLFAFSLDPAGWWLRRGEEEWLGDIGGSPHQTKVLGYIRNDGSCYIGGGEL